MSMLDLTESRRLIETTIEANFAECPVIYENLQVPDEKDLKEWISVKDKQTFSMDLGMNEDAYQVGGNIVVAIFVPVGTGTERAKELAEAISAVLANTSLGGIALGTPEFHGNPGGDIEIPWYQMNLLVPYTSIMGQESSC